MKLAAMAAWTHKWLALIVGVQVLFWVGSGLFFAAFPIAHVRSEHRIAARQAPPLNAARSPAEIAALLPEAPTRLTYERDVVGRQVAVAEFGRRRPILIDLDDWRVASPLDADAAALIARTYIAGSPRVKQRRLVTAETPEYRGPLPAWRVAFDDAEGLTVYVVADTGRVAARRSDLWRVYDALWALHIMDWRDHENFNTGLLMLTSFTALLVVLAGFILFPHRMGWVRQRAR
jgi:hypothetical protein